MNSLNKISKILILTLILVTGIFGRGALAHTMWLNLSDYSPPVGGGVIVYFGWGHRYPVHDLLDQERFLRNLYLINPAGKIEELSPNPGGLLATRIDFDKEGTYLATAELKPGFYTMWFEEGKINHRIGPKTGLSNVMVSTYYQQFAKAIINVDTGDSNFVTPIGQKIEIVPLKNPISLKEGDYLPIRILYEGNPLSSYPTIYATYLGFSTQHDTYAYTTTADREGIAEIKIIRSGVWMVKVNYKTHPTEELKDKCDELSYTATLSFEVR
ncbi:MAG: DUF4198 domain-containing protein [candidate division Zixibacteria bacterium]|nr:DUF4198 domain-containing protein [candidate division Zixibacteria bacterium]